MQDWARSLAIGALVVGVAAAGLAVARGPDTALPGITQGVGAGGGFFGSPDAAPSRAEDVPQPVHHKHASTSTVRHGYANGNAVCVRLCDGFFFPAPAGGDAGCASLCPGAPTELYAMTSDRIDDAYAMSTGAPYTKLPVAKRYQDKSESTCSCRGTAVASHTRELLHDVTLRRGDVVMTAEGFRVYEGSGWGEAKPQDFVAVGKAGLPRDESAELQAMEHANVGHVAAPAPTVVAERPKGNVTVDDGPTTR